MFSQNIDCQWPELFVDAASMFSVVNFDIFSMMSLDCFVSSNYYSQLTTVFAISVVGPFLMMLSTTAWYSCSAWCQLYIMSYWSEMSTNCSLAKSSGSDSRSFMAGAAVAAMLAFVRLVISRMQI